MPDPGLPVPIRIALFDFDGTLSTIRQGWEQVMLPLMLELIAGPAPADDRLRDQVSRYIDQSTGIQTIEQMKWLAGMIRTVGKNPAAPSDPWACKALYQQRLIAYIAGRRQALESGSGRPEDYLIAGSAAFLRRLAGCGVSLFLASGTDESDVRQEAGLLGLTSFFQEIAGALPFSEDCAKESVIRRLLAKQDCRPDQLAIIGDGPVEIRIGVQAGARTVGLASRESERHGADPRKTARLREAGAGCIAGDFTADSLAVILPYLGLKP